MLGKTSGVLVCCLWLCFITVPVNAAEEESEATAGVIFTPRAWFAFVDLVNEANDSTEQFSVPLYGGTVTVIPSFAPNFNILLTGLHGSGDGKFLTQSTLVGGTVDMTRTDIELLLRYNFPGKKFYVMSGLRYVNSVTEKVSPAFSSWDEFWFYGGELGFGFTADITDDSMHRLFANLGFLYGYSRFGFSDTTGFLVDASNNHFGIDGNAGYQFWITSNANVSIRYRVFTLTQPNDFVQTELITFHGPEFSVGWVF